MSKKLQYVLIALRTAKLSRVKMESLLFIEYSGLQRNLPCGKFTLKSGFIQDGVVHFKSPAAPLSGWLLIGLDWWFAKSCSMYL